ncbi:MAG: TIGR01777 family oxidoreductase [Opitutales bacterium]|jgi:hypothetical protein
MRKVIMSGGSGLVGTLLKDAMDNLGWQVVILTRGSSGPGLVHWDPMAGVIDPAGLEGCDYVVHLAGESIATGRWTRSRKRLIMESREKGTRLLAEALAKARMPPRVLLSASGSNYYKDNDGGSPWDESGPSGSGFLSEVCRRWEAAAYPAQEAGIRVVHARMGAVLSNKGGILTRMLPAICSGMGGVIGSGRQRISWIHADDLVRALIFMLQKDAFLGPVNVASPIPVSNRDLTRAIAKKLHRLTFLPMPKTAIWWLFGEMGEELLLADNAISPLKLLENGMQWEFAEIDEALTDLLETHKCRG